MSRPNEETVADAQLMQKLMADYNVALSMGDYRAVEQLSKRMQELRNVSDD